MRPIQMGPTADYRGKRHAYHGMTSRLLRPSPVLGRPQRRCLCKTVGRERVIRRNFIGGLATTAAALNGLRAKPAAAEPAEAVAVGTRLTVDGSAPGRLKLGGLPVRLRGLAMGEVMDARRWRPTSDYRTVAGAWS